VRLWLRQKLHHTGTQILLLVLLPFILWIVWAVFGIDLMVRFWEWRGADATRFTKLGQTGDLFGGINALFAAYAFAGVALAAFFQYKSFQLLKEEQTLQAFEPLFFRLLELSRGERPSASLNLGGTFGPLGYVVEDVASKIESRIADSGGVPDEALARAAIVDTYEKIYGLNEQTLGPYFRSLYHLFKRIDSSGLPDVRKVQYANIGRATLGPDELFLLMLNCAVPKNREFRRLVEEYGLLKHMSLNGDDTHCRRMSKLLPPLVYAPTATMSAMQRDDYLMDLRLQEGLPSSIKP